MPNFTIRRKKKNVQPQAAPPAPKRPQPVYQEEKVDETEEYMSDSSSEEYIDAAMKDLKISQPQNRPQNPPPVQNRPQYPPQSMPHYPQRANVAPQRPVSNHYGKHFGPTPTITDPYLRKPTMQTPYSRPQQKKRSAKIRFRSHYGAGSEHLDTRTKSLMLYSHCFG